MGKELCNSDRQRKTCYVRVGWRRRERDVEALLLAQ